MGLDIELVCVNHWQTAIDTHKLNHPKARHYVQDIATVRPHLIVPEGYLDLLMASPTCTHHSVARGGKPTSDQQRSDPWHIITWLTELRVKRIIIENVWEFTGWGPVDPKTGKPIASRKGEYFHAWIETLKRLGFDPSWHKLNAADFGAATTRQRFILMARSDGRRVVFPTPTHTRKPNDDLTLFPGMQQWRGAREIIDWRLKGRSIFGRSKDLAPKTMARIYAGAVKHGWPRPYLVILRNHMAARGIDLPLPTIAANGQHIGLAEPVLVKQNFRRDVQGVDQPAPTIMTQARLGLAEPLMLRTDMHQANGLCVTDTGAPVPTLTTSGGIAVAEPVIVSPRHAKEGAGPRPRGVNQPLPTITAGGSQMAIAEPIIVNMKGQSTATSADAPLPTQTAHAGHLYAAEPIILSQNSTGVARSTDDPLPTITTGGAGSEERQGCGRHMLVAPFIATVAHGNSPGDLTADERRSQSMDQPLGALHAGGGKYALVEPFVLSQASGGVARLTSDPVPTIPTDGAHALISPYYGGGSGETCSAATEPLPTATAKARFGIVVPVTNGRGGPGPRSMDEPLPTMTTAKGGEFAMVMPVTHHDGSDRVRAADEPLPTVTGANRGELAFIAAQFGEREGQAPRTHDVDAPTPTIAATGRVNLVEGVEDLEGYDILFRMLEPHELAAAMSFIDDEHDYKFAGTKTDQIKQIGNAVEIRKLKACIKSIMGDAVPRQRTSKAKADTDQPEDQERAA